jgi:hypothetical protein
VGGPSIIFQHYHEKNKTKIRDDKVCKCVLGFDANALYLESIAKEMLCGEHIIVEPYEGILDDVLNEKFFGVMECDIDVPENLKDVFSEMSPIFKNTDISYNDISEDTKRQVKPTYKSRKLIGSMFGRKMLFHTSLLKWYLSKGLEVTNITLAVKYNPKQPFKDFEAAVSDARRKGDSNKDYKLIGEMMKLIGNSAYGKCLTNFLKHESVSIVPDEKYAKNVRKINYKSHQDLVEGYEFRFAKTQHKQNLPIQIGFAVYQLAKLRMLQFYYDFVDFYFDRSDFQYCEMDTDSAYIAFSSENLDKLVKPHLVTHFIENKHLWFGRDDTEANKLYDKRTPGLFKLEFRGDGIVALASKMYYCFGEQDKFSSKGINRKQNSITKRRYLDALENLMEQQFVNKGFRVKNNQISTYQLTKSGMKLFNDKRLRTGFTTKPPNM